MKLRSGSSSSFHRVDLALEPLDLAGMMRSVISDGAKSSPGGGEIGAQIEHLVLDAGQHRAVALAGDMEQGHPDRAVRLVHIADRGHAGVRL
jgi:hypothetical protein